MDKSDQKLKRGFSWGMLVLGVLTVLVLLVTATPVVMKANKKADMTCATSNAKQVFYLMIEFDGDYQQFPSDATAILHTGSKGEPNVDLSSFKGKYSNDYMGQFIAAGYTKSEQIFVAPWEKDPSRKADDIISSRELILQGGECGFSYVKNQSTSEKSGRPLLVAPMKGEGFKFDPRIYGCKAVVLRIDGAVKQLLIDRERHLAKIGGGKTLFQTGPDTVWGENGVDESMLVHPAPNPSDGEDGRGPSIFAKIILGLLICGIIVMFTRKRKKRCE